MQSKSDYTSWSAFCFVHGCTAGLVYCCRTVVGTAGNRESTQLINLTVSQFIQTRAALQCHGGTTVLC